MRYAIAFGFALAVAIATAAHSQDGWLEKGGKLLEGLGGGAQKPGSLSDAQIGNGLTEALRVGTERVVATLGRSGGFNNNADVHIPLPGSLARVKKALAPLGMDGMANDLELRLNRAAEAATPRAKALFWDAIGRMKFEDVRNILNGPNDAATQYFRRQMSSPLRQAMAPVVNEELAQVGAIRSYDQMMAQYRSLPFVPDVKADLSDYVLGKAIDGIFLYLGREEAAIRQDPGKRTTDILRQVFR